MNSNSNHGTRNQRLNTDLTENDLNDRNNYLSKNNQLVNEIRSNKAKRRDQFISKRLFKLTNQELQKFEAINYRKNSNLRDLW